MRLFGIIKGRSIEMIGGRSLRLKIGLGDIVGGYKVIEFGFLIRNRV